MTFLTTAIIIATSPGYFEAPHPLRTTTTYGGAIIEERTGKLLWSRDPITPRYPASTTKIMTTLLMLENCNPEDVIVAPPEIKSIKESSMHLEPGEGVRVKNMAYALMLRSANDGCYAVAKHIAGSTQAFAEMMNARAKQIGCESTNFVTPNGLHSPQHTTTPVDLCLIGREAMRREDFREIVRTKKKVIDRSINFRDRMMESRNRILWLDSTADGIKTGYTNPAGHTYVGSATRDGMRIIDSLMYAPKWKEDHQRMMDWAFSEYELKLIQPKGDIPKELLSQTDLLCKAELRQDAFACIRRSGDRVETTVERADAKRPFQVGDRVGSLVIKDQDNFTQRLAIYATTAEPEAAIAIPVEPKMAPIAFAILGVCGISAAGTLAVRARKLSPRSIESAISK